MESLLKVSPQMINQNDFKPLTRLLQNILLTIQRITFWSAYEHFNAR